MEIRRSSPSDRTKIQAIYDQYVQTSVATFDLALRTPAAWSDWWELRDADAPVWVASDGTDLLGFAYDSRFRDKPGYAKTRETTVYIDSTQQRRGCGRALYETLIADAKRREMHTLIAVLSGNNPASESFHRSLGFECRGHLREVGFKFGQAIDTYYWQKMLLPV